MVNGVWERETGILAAELLRALNMEIRVHGLDEEGVVCRCNCRATHSITVIWKIL